MRVTDVNEGPSQNPRSGGTVVSVWATALALAVTACSSPAVPEGSTSSTSEAVVATTTTTSTVTTATTAASESPATSPVGTVGAGVGLVGLELPGIGGLVLEPGPGNRPTLRWDPVAEATRYFVVVSTADGGPYWATGTDTTSVTVAEGFDPAFEGPRIVGGMTWLVLAYDAEGAIVAQSPVSIAPD